MGWLEEAPTSVGVLFGLSGPLFEIVVAEMIWEPGNLTEVRDVDIFVSVLLHVLNIPKHDIVALLVKAKIIAVLLVLEVNEHVVVQGIVGNDLLPFFWSIEVFPVQLLVLNVLSVGMDDVLHPLAFLGSGQGFKQVSLEVGQGDVLGCGVELIDWSKHFYK